MNFTETYEQSYIKEYFKLVKNRATEDRPLHRAKAFKLTNGLRDGSCQPLRKKAGEEFWQAAQAEQWVRVNDMGYITGLSERGERFLTDLEHSA